MFKIRNSINFLFLIIVVHSCLGQIQTVKHEHTTRPKGSPYLTCSLCKKVHDPVEAKKLKLHKGNCSHCNSEGRIRTLPYLVSSIIPKYVDKEIVKNRPVLTFSAAQIEIKYLKKIFAKVKPTVFWGNEGWSKDTENGVDARDLSRYKSNSFSGTLAIGTYDFFVEQEQAIKEAYRVIAPGGIFMVMILPYRLTDDNNPPIVGYKFHSTDTYFKHISRDVEMVSVKVGKKWYVDAMNRAGFKGHAIDVYDEISRYTFTWFIGEKPINNS